jgi:hypothetical protein
VVGVDQSDVGVRGDDRGVVAALEGEVGSRELSTAGQWGPLGLGPTDDPLGPAHGDPAEPDPGQVADGVHGHLGVVGAGLDAEVAVGALRVQLVSGEVRQPDQGLGSTALDPEPVGAVLFEERGAEAEREGQAGRGQTDGLARVIRRRVVVTRRGPVLARTLALGHPGRGRRPLLEQRHEVLARVGDDVEGGEVQPVLHGGDDPGLVLPVERVAQRTGRHTARGLGVTSLRQHPARDTGAEAHHSGAGRAQQSTAAEPALLRPGPDPAVGQGLGGRPRGLWLGRGRVAHQASIRAPRR